MTKKTKRLPPAALRSLKGQEKDAERQDKLKLPDLTEDMDKTRSAVEDVFDVILDRYKNWQQLYFRTDSVSHLTELPREVVVDALDDLVKQGHMQLVPLEPQESLSTPRCYSLTGFGVDWVETQIKASKR